MEKKTYRAKAKDNENHLYLGSKYTDNIEEFYAGDFDKECHHCGALSFPTEHGRVKHNCCHGGKIKLDELPEYPTSLERLFCSDELDHVKFRKNIRFYNNAFSMATFCPKEEIPIAGGGSMKIAGAVTAMVTSSLLPSADTPPRNAQIYIYDPKEALNYTSSEMCKPSILKIIQEIMLKNPYVKQYKSLYSAYKKKCAIPRIYFLRTLHQKDKVHSMPSGNGTRELAAILVCGTDGKHFDFHYRRR